MLVGDVANRTAILIDDLADTCNTITRAAKLLKKEKATQVIALVTHGVLSGDAIERVKASALDKVVVTNSVDQSEHKKALGNQLDILEVGNVFAEVCLFTQYFLSSRSWIADKLAGNQTCPSRREHQCALPLRLMALSSLQK